MKTIALVAKHGKREAVTLAQKLKRKYPRLTFLAEAHLASRLGWRPTADMELGRRADLVVVLGGDGTLIQAARLLRGRAVPILGVNLGSLGFMTEVPVEGLFPFFDRAVRGKARIESRMKLSCRLLRGGRVLVEDEVLNEVVINKSALARIADHETWLGDDLVALFKSDGVIFSTPTGSTAYSLSAGGPIVHPQVDCVVVTPICPHALTQRPLVVPAHQVLRTTLKSEVSDVYLTMDGKTGHPLETGDRIEVQRSKNRVHVVRNDELEYFGILREKLHWGER